MADKEQKVRIVEWPEEEARLEHRIIEWPKEEARLDHRINRWPEEEAKLEARIVKWPEEKAVLEHHFKMKGPCPVSISFEKEPASVIVGTEPEKPLAVNMSMQVHARQPIPVCIRVCEPICARSDYNVGFNWGKNSFASITVRGETRVYSCGGGEAEAPATCTRFTRVKAGMEFAEPLVYEGLEFVPLEDPLRTVFLGDPAGEVKLGFPPSGLRIVFPGTVRNVKVTVNSYAGGWIEFRVYSGDTLADSWTEEIHNAVRQVVIPQPAVTAVEISGGGNESSLVEVCYTPGVNQVIVREAVR